MKIVCEACQAKYSIADEKVRGKVFKIRCKKCSHVIVVRGSGEPATGASAEFAASPSSAPDLALDAGWHIVVDGEQVGPLSEGDIRARLARGEIGPDTYIWKEGLPDWVKISTMAEWRSEPETGSPFTAAEEGGPFAGAATQVSASPPGVDVFAPSQAAAGGAVPDLFAAPVHAGGGERASASAGVSASPAAFGGFESAGGGAATLDPFSPSFVTAGGNGSAGGAAAGMTGQRHENSVLFSLSNLEALAKPASAPLPAVRSPGASAGERSTTTEGSGLIDIRAMANMTLGAGATKSESKGSDLPAFSAPQFSPVAPVLLAPGAGGGTPRWAIGVLIFLGVVALALTFVVVKLFTGSTPAPVVTAPPAAAPAAPVAAAPVAPPAEKTPPVTPPPATNEELPPREPAKPAAAAAQPDKPDKPERGSGKPGRNRRGGGARASADDPEPRNAAVTPTPKPVAEAPRKPKDELDMLLEAAAPGGRKSGGGSAPAARRDDEEPRGERAAPLSSQDVVRGMSAVMPKARDCYNQYKVPGVANVKVTVMPSGRVSNVVVTGKFAGTPSGSCVESALKTAKFNPSAGLTFDYVVPLR
jgi:predicted Zn finger-like uncharacterized protein